MNKPQYELTPLRLAIQQHRTNILAFQNAISKEEQELDECQKFIRKWEEYNKGQNGNTSESIIKS